MKKYILAFVLLLTFCGTAFAEQGKFLGITFEIPEGYKYDDQGYGISLTTPNGEAALVLATEDSQGDTADVIALSLSLDFNGTAPTLLENGFYGFTFQDVTGLMGKCMVSTNGHDALVALIIGEDPPLVAIYDSIR